MLGSIVLHFSQWHTIFGVLAAYSAVLILLLVWQLPVLGAAEGNDAGSNLGTLEAWPLLED